MQRSIIRRMTLERAVILILFAPIAFFSTDVDSASKPVPSLITEEFIVLGRASEVWYFPIVAGSLGVGLLYQDFEDDIVRGLAILDHDNDLDHDFVAMVQPADQNWNPTGETDLYLFENIGPGFELSQIPETLPVSGGFWFAASDIAAEDFYKDNHHNFVVSISGNFNTKIYLFGYDPPSGTFIQSFIGEATWARHAGWMDAGDADNNDYQDFLIFDYAGSGDFQGDVYLYGGDGYGSFSSSFACQTIHSARDIAVGDFNNDGPIDLIVGLDDDGNPGGAWLHLGDNSGTFTLVGPDPVFDLDPLHNSGSDHFTGLGQMDACDIDDDGDLDIIALVLGTDKPPHNPTLWLIKGNGDGTFKDPIFIEKDLGEPTHLIALSAPLKLKPRSPELIIDIKPRSCPNPLNVKNKGVLPVAILGTEPFDVTEIKTETILLEGVAPIRTAVEDVTRPVSGGNQPQPNAILSGATLEVNIADTHAIGTEQPFRPVPRLQDPCECTTEGPDGFDDLTLKFETQEIVAALGEVNDRDTLELTLTAELMDGTEMETSDCVIILKKGDSKRGGPPEGHIQLSRAKSTIPGVLTAEEFVVAGNVSGQIWYFPIVGGTIDPGVPIYTFSDAVIAGPAILDYDNDLDLDFVAMIQPTDLGGNPTGETHLYLFENVGAAFAVSPIPDTLPISGGFWFALSDIVVEDFWKDGYHDFVVSIVGDQTTKLYLFNYDSTNATFKQAFIADADWATHAGRMDAGDAQRDDYQDFIIFDYPRSGDFQDDVYLYSGDGYGSFSSSFVCQTIHSARDITVGDFNNNNCLDLIVGLDDDGNPGGAWLYLGDSSGTFILSDSTPVFDLDPLHNSGEDHKTGIGYMDAYDVDKDGNLDVIAFVLGADEVPYNPTLWLIKGIGDGTFEDPIMIQEGIGGTSLPTSISAPLKLQTTLVEEDALTDRGMPAAFLLSQNYPNPVTKSSTIQYTLPRECHVTLEVYNAAGQKMITLVNEKQSPGYRAVTLDTKSLPDGVYFYRLEAGDFRTSRKMIVLR